MLIKLSKTPPVKKKYIREGRAFAIQGTPTGAITFLHVYTTDGERREDNLGHYSGFCLTDFMRYPSFTKNQCVIPAIFCAYCFQLSG